jgi:hypothetical protein
VIENLVVEANRDLRLARVGWYDRPTFTAGKIDVAALFSGDFLQMPLSVVGREVIV